MLVLLAYLQTWEVWVAQLHLVLVQKVLGDGALHRLAVVKLEGEGLHLSGATGHVANTVFPAKE